jgi:hypothetical protein
MSISYYLGNKYYPIPYDLKEIGGYLSLSILFQPYHFMVQRLLCWNRFINRVPHILSITMKSNADENYKG